jgi:hypothetical protein
MIEEESKGLAHVSGDMLDYQRYDEIKLMGRLLEGKELPGLISMQICKAEIETIIRSLRDLALLRNTIWGIDHFMDNIKYVRSMVEPNVRKED